MNIYQPTLLHYATIYATLALSIYAIIKNKPKVKEQTPVEVLDFTTRVVRYKGKK